MLYYVTGNQNKIAVAKQFLDPDGVDFHPHPLELTEIQSHSIKEIARDKAQKAYKKLQHPLFVNDHGWSITALNGFPGAYMKYMNEWLLPQDFLNLMQDKKEREVFLTEVICYIDEHGLKIFSEKYYGKMLHEVQGDGRPATTIISLTEDNVSIAKKLETNPSALEKRSVWRDFATWYKLHKANQK